MPPGSREEVSSLSPCPFWTRPITHVGLSHMTTIRSCVRVPTPAPLCSTGFRRWIRRDRLSFPLHQFERQSPQWGTCITSASEGEESHLYSTQIIYHPQSGWFEDTPLKGVHKGTCLIEAGGRGRICRCGTR